MEVDGTVRETFISRRPTRPAKPFATGTLFVMACFSFVYLQPGAHPEVARALSASGRQVFEQHEVWRLFTTILIHADFQHFLSNAIPLGILVYLVYGYLGLWQFPVWAMILGALTNVLTLMGYPRGVTLVGASGVVYLLAGFWLTLVWFVDLRFTWVKRTLRVVGFTMIMLLPSTLLANVSYRAHAIGFALGVLWAFVILRLKHAQIAAAQWIEPELEPLPLVPLDAPGVDPDLDAVLAGRVPIPGAQSSSAPASRVEPEPSKVPAEPAKAFKPSWPPGSDDLPN